jgi:hypothetical protein
VKKIDLKNTVYRKHTIMSSSVLTIESWVPSEVKYGIAKPTKLGKAITVFSSKTNKFLEISMPRMMTWGISDFYDKEKDTHDGKFSLDLNFPPKDLETEKTVLALEKMKAFQDQILKDVCKHKNEWFDHVEDVDDSMVKTMMYKFVKYPKDKENKKKTDYNRPPHLSAKVECWDGKWKPRIFDTKKNLLFPSSDPQMQDATPADFVPKMSNVSCTIECGGVWIGEKTWGITWRLKQCVVKPNEGMMSNSDVCTVEFDDEDATNIENQKVSGDDVEVDTETGTIYKAGVPVKTTTTIVEDSDDDEPVAAAPVAVAKVAATPAPEPAPAPAQVAEEEEPVAKAEAPKPKRWW